MRQEHIHGSINKSVDAFAGSGSLFRIEPSWLSCRLPVVFRLRLVLQLYEQRMIGKKGLLHRQQSLWRYKIQYGKGGLRF